jgi:hypothetical protein
LQAVFNLADTILLCTPFFWPSAHSTIDCHSPRQSNTGRPQPHTETRERPRSQRGWASQSPAGESGWCSRWQFFVFSCLLDLSYAGPPSVRRSRRAGELSPITMNDLFLFEKSLILAMTWSMTSDGLRNLQSTTCGIMSSFWRTFVTRTQLSIQGARRA